MSALSKPASALYSSLVIRPRSRSSLAAASLVRRSAIALRYGRNLSRRWFYYGFGDFLNSDQQQLSLRTTLGGAIGRWLARTNRVTLNVAGGAAWNRERYRREGESLLSLNSPELAAGLDFAFFLFDSTRIETSLLVFPSLQTKRTRMDFNADLYLDLWGDWYWRIGLFDNFDSAPPITAPRNDLGLNLSLGVTF